MFWSEQNKKWICVVIDVSINSIEGRGGHRESFQMYIYQITTLCTLNILQFCELYLSKT